MKRHFLVLDVGTTGVKAFVFTKDLKVLVRVYKPLKKYFPQKGWVEQNADDFLTVSKNALRMAIDKSSLAKESFFALGIASQRETTILWNKKTGRPLYPAIVWEDSRTKKYCQRLKKKFGQTVRLKTGLFLEPYFSASKIAWILENVKEAKKLLSLGQLAFGTVDSWVLGNFLVNNPHLTDYTNASRTLVFNIKTLTWDRQLLKIFTLPASILPEVLPSASFFGVLKDEILGFSLPVLAVLGDQQASMFAAGVSKKTTKITYGTGTFVMQVLGAAFLLKKPFFTTLVPKKSSKKPLYALEAKIACCGRKVEPLLGKPEALQTLFEKLAFKVNFYLQKLPFKAKELIVDGGVSQSPDLISIQEKTSHIPLRRQKIFDGTAAGVAKLLLQTTSV